MITGYDYNVHNFSSRNPAEFILEIACDKGMLKSNLNASRINSRGGSVANTATYSAVDLADMCRSMANVAVLASNNASGSVLAAQLNIKNKGARGSVAVGDSPQPTSSAENSKMSSSILQSSFIGVFMSNSVFVV